MVSTSLPSAFRFRCFGCLLESDISHLPRLRRIRVGMDMGFLEIMGRRLRNSHGEPVFSLSGGQIQALSLFESDLQGGKTGDFNP